MITRAKVARLVIWSGCLLVVLWIGYIMLYLSVLPVLFLIGNLYTGTPRHLVPRPVIQYYLLDTKWGTDRLRHSSRYMIPLTANTIPTVQSKTRNAKNIALMLVLLRKLIKLGKPINIRLHGYTALSGAVMFNQPALARFLIRHGASVKSFRIGRYVFSFIGAAYCDQHAYPNANITPMLRVLEKAYHGQGVRINLKQAHADAKQCRQQSDKNPMIFMDR